MDAAAEEEELQQLKACNDDDDAEPSTKPQCSHSAGLAPENSTVPESTESCDTNTFVVISSDEQQTQAMLYDSTNSSVMLVPTISINEVPKEVGSDLEESTVPILMSVRIPEDDTRYSSIRKNPRMYMCAYCDKRYTSKSSVYFHIRQHHQDKGDGSESRPIFMCPECDKTFVCKSSLSQHMNLKHLIGNIYKCHYSECNKSFNTASDLTRHLRTHSGEKPFKCDLCDKAFTCKSSLSFHVKTHGAKQWICSTCEKQFNTKSDLNRHESTHTGKKDWECRVCRRGYSCKSALKVHIKGKHKKLLSSDKFKLFNEPDEGKSTLNSAELVELMGK